MAMLLCLHCAVQCWAEETANSDLPPVGRSRFDQFIGDRPVPFPFSRLIARLRAQAAPQQGGLYPVKAVLIPLGRSLQRAAGAPDFFRFPRAVATVDGATRPGIPPLRDRLFVGYHEKGGLLEVISYNASAGRFEFQVVRDYRRGGRPRLVYARRALCLACHQNAAPLFSRPLWDETPANPSIAARLRAEGRDFYGIPLAGTDIAYFLDNATDRANLLPVWQLLWRQGCGDGESGRRCRIDLFGAALAQGLSGVPRDDAAQSVSGRELARRWPQLWPHGLEIPNPDIPDRNPLVTLPGDGPGGPGRTTKRGNPAALPELARLSHIPARFEPLNPRPPLETWTAPNINGLVDGLADMLAPADLDELDRVLAARPAPTQVLKLRCHLRRRDARRTGFSCASDDTRSGVNLSGALTRQSGKQVAGRLDRLGLAGAPADIRLTGSVEDAAGQEIRLEPRRFRRHARLADGRRLAALILREGGGSLVLADDFAVARGILTALSIWDAKRTFPDWDGMAMLLTALGAHAKRAPTRPLPPAQSIGAGHAADDDSTGGFRRFCGQCHDTPEPFPPNYLYGDSATVTARLAQCAPRILYRLSMWDLPEARRGKTPMPPPPSLAAHRLNGAAWTRSPERAALLARARRLVAARGLDPRTLTQRPFETLPPCLPAATGLQPSASLGRKP